MLTRRAFLIPTVPMLGVFLVVLALAGGSAGQKAGPAAPAGPVNLEESLKKATASGKYEMLLRQIKVEKDSNVDADFQDLGYRERREYAGHADLPSGHWVYVAPYWYIWRDLKATPKPRRAWGPEQATGPPDTWPRFGDVTTAWASLTEDAQDEWLLLEYAEPVVPRAVLIYATYNPGAVSRVSAFKLDGTEVEVWKGKDPTPVGAQKGLSVIPIRVNFKTNRIKIDIASKEVGGWNEIDAVGLRTRSKTYWATSVEASSTYARQPAVAVPVPPRVDADAEALDNLEKEVRLLKQTVKRLEMRIKKRKMN
jgi:hypothetical protein